MKKWVVLVALVACRPLEPGETRCSTTFGVTSCKSGPTQVQVSAPPPVYTPPPPPPPAGWWCSLRADGFGICSRRPGDCEVARTKSGAGDGTHEGFGACGFLQTAFCTDYGCFSSPSACAQFERFEKRDGSACAAFQ